MPRRYWHSNYAPFPMVQYDFDSQEVLNEQMDPKIQMSEIPEELFLFTLLENETKRVSRSANGVRTT